MPQRTRLPALDVFRGATVAAMLLVNNPGNWAHVYPPLLHAEWHGLTPTDLIFPFFLFIVGITTRLSFERQLGSGADRGQIMARATRRGLLIVLSGLLLNWFPFYAWGELQGVDDPSALDRIVHRWEHLRWTGVLQRIGVVYLLVAPIALHLRRRTIAATTASLLIAWAALLVFVPVPGTEARGLAAISTPDQTIAAWSDRVVIGSAHLWRGGAWDPEGVLSTLGAMCTTLLGVLAAPFVSASDLRRLLGWGFAAVIAGFVASTLVPLNKNLWTSSYVLVTAGAGMIYLAIVMRTIRMSPGPIARFFRTFGLNPYVAFVGSGLMTRIIVSLVRVPDDGRMRPFQVTAHEVLFASWLPPRLASLAWAVLFVMVWFAILRAMERRNWIVKL